MTFPVWVVVLLLVLLVLSRRPGVARDMTPLALRVAERYGPTDLGGITQDKQRRLEPILTAEII